jgi:hypothetical protein
VNNSASGSGRVAEVHRGTSVQHVYTAAEVTRLVAAAEVTDVDLYGQIDGTPFQLGSHRLLLAARAALGQPDFAGGADTPTPLASGTTPRRGAGPQ